MIVSVNDVNLGTAAGVSAAPDAIDATGFNPAYSDDSSIHFSDHGPFSDERIKFPVSLLHAGQNTITIQMDARSLTAYLMVDYLRLELTGYVPPPPAGVTAYAGDKRVLVRWPAVPGATSYNVLRSTSPGGGYAPVATALVGPVSGSDTSDAACMDVTAVNGTQYYYVVESVNPGGHSTPSSPSTGTTPSPQLSSSAPPAPTGLAVTESGHHRVALSWNASPGANFYTVWRTALHTDGVGGTYPLRWAVLDDATTGTAYTDASPTDGRTYSYCVMAVSVAGSSSASTVVTAKPLPAPPASAPRSLAGHWIKTREGEAITLSWSPVPGAIGYVIYRSKGSEPSFRWPENFLTALVETTYVDKGPKKKHATRRDLPDGDYNYQVTAVNAAGISLPATVHVPAQ